MAGRARPSPNREAQLKLLVVVVAISVLIGWLTGPLAGVIAFALLLLSDRVLLFAESRGILNYRRNGPSRGAATYHTLQLSAIFSPSMHEVIEAKYERKRQADASGDPPPLEDDAAE